MRSGGLRLFRAFGIDVYLHWTWAIVAGFFIYRMREDFEQPIWAAVTYCGLFAIVLIHEFGHSLACKSVGGTADTIMLWPLGGIAFVNPPLRPGAVLWSIAAGPLVNVMLFPLLWYLWVWFPEGDLGECLGRLWMINAFLLAFNLLPIYPLDGGQILHSLLWFFLGFSRALLIASIIGLVGAIPLLVLMWLNANILGAVIGMFIMSQAWRGFVMAKALRRRPDPTTPLEEQIREVVEEQVPVPPAVNVEPQPATVDPTTQRIVSETYEQALQRERLAALRGEGDNRP